MRIGAVFPGQGSQAVGMGGRCVAFRTSHEDCSIVRPRSSVTICSRCRKDGPEERLRETKFSQPAIFTTNYALYSAVGEGFRPIVSAGHSFAEFCSLYAAHSLSFEDALRIVNERGTSHAGSGPTRSRRR